jgi:hypothetical protein
MDSEKTAQDIVEGTQGDKSDAAGSVGCPHAKPIRPTIARRPENSTLPAENETGIDPGAG